jgi:Tol biopolymer transport system component
LDADIYRIERTGPGQYGRPERLIASTQVDRNPAYSPDGSQIVIESFQSGDCEVYLYDSEGNYLRKLTQLEGRHGGDPWWSPDGESIAYFSTVESIHSNHTVPWADIFVVSAKGGTARRISDGQARTVQPTWSRDGRYVYAVSNRGGELGIWKFSLEEVEPTLVAEGPRECIGESSDGFLYFLFNEDRVSRIPIEGGTEEVMMEIGRVLRPNIHMAEDGIYFMNRGGSGEKARLRFFNFATKETSLILEVERPGFGISVSPDGRYILYTRNIKPGQDLNLIENFWLD